MDISMGKYILFFLLFLFFSFIEVENTIHLNWSNNLHEWE